MILFSKKMDSRTTISMQLFTLSAVISILSLWRQRQCKDDASIIYLDYNGTTPVNPVVLNAMMPYLQEHFGNPSSSHALGDAPREAIDRARMQILTHLLGVNCGNPDKRKDAAIDLKESIVFTGCGTEADNLAIHLALQLKNCSKDSLPHIVTTNVEHPAVEVYLRVQELIGRCTVTRVHVQHDGCVTAEDMIAAIQPNTALVMMMLANNETGAVQPVRDVALYCRKHGILVATDAAQAAGKISVRLTDLGNPDMVVLVGHKIGAPKGIACLYIRPGCLEQLSKAKQHHVVDGLLIGGGQEFGWRGGTPNVPYIVAFGMAAERCVLNFDHKVHHMEEMRSRLLKRLHDALGESNIRVHGPTDAKLRLPNTVFVSFSGIQSGQLLQEMRYQVAASAGASCHSPSVNGSASSSSVLKAMQVPDMWAIGTVRLSLGPQLTMDQVDRAVDCLVSTVRRQWCSSRSQS